MRSFLEWIGLPSRTTITVKVTLVGDESSTYHDLQQDFLENLKSFACRGFAEKYRKRLRQLKASFDAHQVPEIFD